MLPIDAPEVVERVRSGLALVNRVAAQVHRSLGMRVELEELVSAGREGLVEAAQRYEPERGISFLAYAHTRIRGATLDAARRMGGLPRRTFERATALAAAANIAEGGLGTLNLLQEQVSADPQRIMADRLAAFATASMIALTANDQREQAPSLNPEVALERAQLLDVIRREMSALQPDLAELMRRHFLEEEPLEQIAKSMHITGSWAGRLLAQGVAKLSRAVRRRL